MSEAKGMVKSMKIRIKQWIKKQAKGFWSPVFYVLYEIFTKLEYKFFSLKYFFALEKKPDKKEIEQVCQNVTFVYKSFERQKMAKRLYRNIQSFYPGASVIIADDSKKKLSLKGRNLTIIQLPFNSGLSYGLNKALENVKTPFLMRMDDDELLTRRSKIEKELQFLQKHPEVDLVGFGVLQAPYCRSTCESAKLYYGQSMNRAPKALLIPHMTPIDKEHIVVGKVPNIFLARTDKIKAIGYDDQIRMIDHNEFFMRAAGHIVSVMNPYTAVFHYHNMFDRNYQKYRNDIATDQIYIAMKHRIRNMKK